MANVLHEIGSFLYKEMSLEVKIEFILNVEMHSDFPFRKSDNPTHFAVNFKGQKDRWKWACKSLLLCQMYY